MCRGFESYPSSSFFFSEKKELFELVVLPCLIFIGLRVFMNVCTYFICLRTVGLCSGASPAPEGGEGESSSVVPQVQGRGAARYPDQVF